MNINEKVWAYARRLSLDWIATGGGCDFIFREYKGWDIVLGSKEDCGTSPDSLDEPSLVSLYPPNSNWLTGIFLEFKSAKKAMKFMAGKINYAIYERHRGDMVDFLDEHNVTKGEEDEMQEFLLSMRKRQSEFILK